MNSWMDPSQFEYFAQALGIGPLALTIIIIALSLWALVWKAFALWRAARLGSKVWFVVLLVVNTFGILEILYLFVFSKKRGTTSTSAAAVSSPAAE